MEVRRAVAEASPVSESTWNRPFFSIRSKKSVAASWPACHQASQRLREDVIKNHDPDTDRPVVIDVPAEPVAVVNV